MCKFIPTEAIILAGGLGMRLRAVVSDVPKPMAPIQDRPFLEYLLDFWIEQGVSRFIISIGYLAENIESHFGLRYRGCDISYINELTPLGTGGGLRLSLLHIQKRLQSSHILLLNGDTWFEVSLQKLITDALFSNKPITVVVKPVKRNDRYGGISVDALGRVTEFGLNPNSSSLINGGCYLLDAQFVFSRLKNFPKRFSFEGDFLSDMTREGEIAASIQDATFLDIGIPADYALAFRTLIADKT